MFHQERKCIQPLLLNILILAPAIKKNVDKKNLTSTT